MSYETLKFEADQIATITLNRPEKRNAISAQMIDELLAALDERRSSPARVVIITGAGKAFCAGMDLDGLRALARQSPQQHLEDSRRMANMFYRIYSFPKPLIAAVNGAAIAGGCGIATLADFTLAVPEAKFGYTEVKIGFIPALVSVFLRRQVGEKRRATCCSAGESSTRPKRIAWASSPKSCRPKGSATVHANSRIPCSRRAPRASANEAIAPEEW